MSFSSIFARWYAWLVVPRYGAMPPAAARPPDEHMHDRTQVDPPTYLAYHVTAAPTSKQGPSGTVWSRVGAAWLHPDGRGFDVVLDIIPLDGRFILCAPLEDACPRDLPPRAGGKSVHWP
jgi:hypothetical protein